jgi:hypothetical protein
MLQQHSDAYCKNHEREQDEQKKGAQLFVQPCAQRGKERTEDRD